jgi:exportin-1
MEVAAANEPSLTAVDMQQSLHNLLLSNISICKSLGGFFLPQMGKLYAPMLSIYQKYSTLINVMIQQVGPLGSQHATIKRMRSIKQDILKLIETFVEMSDSAEHLTIIAQQFVPTLMDPILSDYDTSLNDAKCAWLQPVQDCTN